MTALTLQQVFGAQASQTSEALAIYKADLTAISGLTPSATNDPVALLAAIIAFAESNAPDSTALSNPDQKVGIADGFQSIQSNGSSQILVTPKTLNFYKPFTGGTFNANDY